MALAGQSYKVAPPSFQLQIHPSCPVSAIATWARCFVIGWTFLDASLVDTLSIVALPWPAQLGPESLAGHSVQRGGRHDNYSRSKRVRSTALAAKMAEFRMNIDP